ncbi:MarR family winged helix-turn-helix transcriptional regulator [Mumia sp. Pv 4-285]|uniref:MarR family winged helix-turn-helix transcriptional regulator n=1 Tax=Mumia qirimensis TaxID=3234852 RepID=UPI00351D9A84
MAMPTIDQQLCFALYSASRAMTASYRPLLDGLGLTYPQYLVMLVMWEDERLTVGHLGARLHLDSGTLSPLLKRLESRGLVARERSAEDERVVEVALTPEGRSLQELARDVPRQAFSATGLSLSDSADLLQAVHQLTRSLEESRHHSSPDELSRRKDIP